MRQSKASDALTLPICPLPRTGDKVTWYCDAKPINGTLQGHGPDGRPYVMTEFDTHVALQSYDVLRFADPNIRKGPCWTDLDGSARIFEPYSHEASRFGDLLGQRIPPGPRYSELVSELWHRGFEVFVVGGTVRDVISQRQTKDVDLVTTMPLSRAKALFQAMFRDKPSIDENNGYVRLGGTPKSGDPFIDLKVFSAFMPGTSEALFGSSLSKDMSHRDFACNAVYYDPVNRALIDPSGRGVQDAEQNRLSLVCRQEVRTPFQRAQIAIRFFKFMLRGFNPTEETSLLIQRHYIPEISAMKTSMRIKYIRAQLLAKEAVGRHEEVLLSFRGVIVDFGAEVLWQEMFEPLMEDFLAA